MVTEETAIDYLIRNKSSELIVSFSIGTIVWCEFPRLISWLVRLVQFELGGQEGSPPT
jgi:hypothetical protein